MSAGDFTIDGKYEGNDGTIYPCRYQPETAAAVLDGEANAAPSGNPTTELSVRLTTGNREFGVTPRKVQLLFTGALPSGYSGKVTEVVALTPFWYNLATKGTTGTYLGVPVKVLRRSPEKVK